MATEEDNFDIDIYGDGGEDYQQAEPSTLDGTAEDTLEAPTQINDETSNAAERPEPAVQPPSVVNGQPDVNMETEEPQDKTQKIASTDDSAQGAVTLPRQAPQTQGLNRQDGADERFVESGATTALFISELHWWVNDDDIRGWANQSECEDELADMTFSEHKVNGKSKGQAYVLFKSPQAATAAKQKIESFGEGQQYTKKFTVSYTNPYTNPFKTLPKDGPMRNSNNDRTSGFRGGPHSQSSGYNTHSSGGGYRGRGGYNRGGGMNGTSGYNRGGFQQPMTGGYQPSPMTGFQGMGGAQPYGGFQNRGGMMGGMRGGAVGLRGNRGGMGANGMMTMPMGGMGMGNMGTPMGGLGMGMPQMGAGMGVQGMQNFPVSLVAVTSSHNPYASVSGAATGSHTYATGSTKPAESWANLTNYSQNSSLSYQASASSTPDLSLQVPPNSALTSNASNAGPSGFQGNQAHYNPAFFPQQPAGQPVVGGADASWNPHGAKRTRQE